jgi:hypothetical protein
MKKLFTVSNLGILLLGFIILSFPNQSLADSMSLGFAKQFENGQNGSSQASSITLDEIGNIYTTGYFYGTVDFDPNEETHELTSSNENDSSFISILANDGSFIGAYKLGDGENGYSQASSITLDEIGNIYTTGYFNGTVDFDPSSETHELTASNGSSFISVLANDGAFIGAYQFENGENGYSSASSLTADEIGNIYTTGQFGGTVDFNPNEEVYELTASNGSSFISILASDGSFIGAYKIGDGQNGSSQASSITLDEIGNIYTTGNLYGTVDFDPGERIFELTSSDNYSSFISILASDGSFIGAYQLNGENSYSQASSISLDEIGNIYTAGYFNGTVDFDPSEETFELTSSNYSSFISILANDGSFIGAYQFGGGQNNTSAANSITIDNEGNIYTAGYFNGTVDFDPSEEEFNMTGCTGECSDTFILKLSSDGSFLGAYQFENGENGSSQARSITLDEIGNIYTAGYFSGTVDFDPSEGTFELTPGSGSTYVVKLSPQQDTPTPAPVRSRTRSTGSSVGAMASFYQDQLKRAISTGVDTTPYIKALNQLPSTPNISTPNTIQRILKQGIQGDDVKTLQTYLNTHNYNAGIADGIFGNLTKQAVVKFQLANGLVGDGIVGPLTKALLK